MLNLLALFIWYKSKRAKGENNGASSKQTILKHISWSRMANSPPPTQKKCESLFVIAKIQLGYVKMEKPCEYNGLNRLNASCGSTRYAKHKSVSEGN